jgi:hypothetical protein
MAEKSAMSEMTTADWTIFLTEPYVDEPYPRRPIIRWPPYCEQDRPPPSPVELARRIARDRALQHWHTQPIAMPFEAWLLKQEQ